MRRPAWIRIALILLLFSAVGPGGFWRAGSFGPGLPHAHPVANHQPRETSIRPNGRPSFGGACRVTQRNVDVRCPRRPSFLPPGWKSFRPPPKGKLGASFHGRVREEPRPASSGHPEVLSGPRGYAVVHEDAAPTAPSEAQWHLRWPERKEQPAPPINRTHWWSVRRSGRYAGEQVRSGKGRRLEPSEDLHLQSRAPAAFPSRGFAPHKVALVNPWPAGSALQNPPRADLTYRRRCPPKPSFDKTSPKPSYDYAGLGGRPLLGEKRSPRPSVGPHPLSRRSLAGFAPPP